jgi:hypothetical protein
VASGLRGCAFASKGGSVNVEVLYFDGCPNHEELLPRLRELMRRAGVSAEIELRAITNDETAQRERFLGSPTVRVDGRDVEPDADRRADFGMKCRLYRDGDGLSGQPADDWILAQLQAGEPSPGRTNAR